MALVLAHMRVGVRTTALLLCVAAPALAALSSVRLGDAVVRFDASRWTATLTPGGAHFEPQGDIAQRLDAVELRALAGSQAVSCADAAQRQFDTGRYDATGLLGRDTIIGGVAAQRFAAHTRCRNATPKGEILCARFGDKTYLLMALQVGCGGRNLFSGIDPLDEIAAGVTFDPAQ